MAKATKREFERRVLDIVELMAQGKRDVTIGQHETVTSWGLKSRQVERYLSAAHKVFAERAQVDRDKEIGDAIAKYDTLIEKAMESGYLKTAGWLIDKRAELIGLKKIIVAGDEDKPVTVKWAMTVNGSNT